MTMLLLPVLLIALGDDAPTIAEGVRETQITLSMERGGKRTQLQGTVIAKEDGILTVLTAAHGLGPRDVGGVIRLKQGDGAATGRVEKADRNPFYRPPPTSDIPGADNAILHVRLDEGGSLDATKLRTAEVAGWAIPEPNGQLVTVQMIDQFGTGHMVKGGNYSNPRWLEWGPAYRPVGGDSGSGVFVLRKKPDGTIGPILVGVVVDRSERGGGASLIHAKDKWVQAARRPIKVID
jgi:hypothetical protein